MKKIFDKIVIIIIFCFTFIPCVKAELITYCAQSGSINYKPIGDDMLIEWYNFHISYVGDEGLQNTFGLANHISCGGNVGHPSNINNGNIAYPGKADDDAKKITNTFLTKNGDYVRYGYGPSALSSLQQTVAANGGTPSIISSLTYFPASEPYKDGFGYRYVAFRVSASDLTGVDSYKFIFMNAGYSLESGAGTCKGYCFVQSYQSICVKLEPYCKNYNDKKQYYLEGAIDVATGQSLGATCDKNGNCTVVG